MKPAPFVLHRPATLDEAFGLLAASRGSARLLAGGQSLMPRLNLRRVTPKVLVDLNRVDGLAGIRRDGDVIRIGAMTRQAALLTDPLVRAHLPLLAAAAAHVGFVQTRSRGTIGGSLAEALPAAEIPLAVIALGASVTFASSRGARMIAAAELALGAGVTACGADEILTEIAIPVPPPGARHLFCELARRHKDVPLAAVAARVIGDRLIVVLGGIEPVPHRCDRLAAAWQAGGSAGLDAAIAAEVTSLAPLSDHHASADYRRHLARVLLEDVVAGMTRP